MHFTPDAMPVMIHEVMSSISRTVNCGGKPTIDPIETRESAIAPLWLISRDGLRAYENHTQIISNANEQN